MPLTKHIRYKPGRVVVFIFLLLNCLLTSAPFINASSINNLVGTSGYLSQHQAADREENNPGKHSLEDRIEYNNAVRNKHRVGTNVSTIDRVFFDITKSSLLGQASDPGFRLRPAYYCLLFLYQLF